MKLRRKKIGDGRYSSITSGITSQTKVKSPRKGKKGKNIITKQKDLRILIDSGAYASIIKAKYVNKIVKSSKKNNFYTKGESFKTLGKTKVNLVLPEFNPHKEIEWKFHVQESDKDTNFDMIIEEDLLNHLGF